MKFSPWRAAIVVAGILIAILVYRYRQPRFVAGEVAPDFSATLADGSRAQLVDLQGKYVLLQFWGSWCGPCRAENPYLVDLYRNFHEQGFEIFSVAIEQNERAWRRAMELDGMFWPYHTVEDGRFDGPVARLYNIHSIPTTFLINPEGMIMGVNWSPDQIRKALERALVVR